MKPLRTDLAIFKKFEFELPPVGVKFLGAPPEGIQRLDKTMALCEMLRETQDRNEAFYIDKDNEDCAGNSILGMAEHKPFPGMGELGVKWGLYQEARVNERLTENAPKVAYGKIKYVAFAPLEKINFDPDLLFLLADTGQAEKLLRAMSYATGEIWESRATPGGACAYLFAYPYLSGKVNYIPTGLTLGLKGRQIYPEGRMLFSMPFDRLPALARNLEQMDWVLPAYTDETREKFLERRKGIFQELFQEFGKP